MADQRQLDRVTAFAVERVNEARAVDDPFLHLELDRFFPDDIYQQIVASLPSLTEYRPMSGRSKDSNRADGSPTRVKIDLFPEYTRLLPRDDRALWDLVGRSLCSSALQDAFMRRLAPGLERRFGEDFADVGMFPVPVLTRDVSGYSIPPHTDTHWKGITVLIYLPPDDTLQHIGTVVHEKMADGSFRRAGQGRFAPNSGMAFAVGDNTWHSVDPVGPEVETRDLIILQYFVDSGLLRMLRNRGKRLGNMLRNEMGRLARVSK